MADMTGTANAFVVRGIAQLRGTLVHLIKEKMENRWHDEWWSHARPCITHDLREQLPVTYGRGIEGQLDFAACLSIINNRDNWNDIFGQLFAPAQRSSQKNYLSELWSVRIVSAHTNDINLTNEDAVRALDTMIRFIKPIDESTATSLEIIKDECKDHLPSESLLELFLEDMVATSAQDARGRFVSTLFPKAKKCIHMSSAVAKTIVGLAHFLPNSMVPVTLAMVNYHVNNNDLYVKNFFGMSDSDLTRYEDNFNEAIEQLSDGKRPVEVIALDMFIPIYYVAVDYKEGEETEFSAIQAKHYFIDEKLKKLSYYTRTVRPGDGLWEHFQKQILMIESRNGSIAKVNKNEE